MTRNSTFSSQAKGRPARTELAYKACPLCGSIAIALRTEVFELGSPSGRIVQLRLRCWACNACGEKFLTDKSRRRLDEAMGLRSPAGT